MARMGSQGSGRRARRQFSDEFIAGAVRLVLDEGKTVGAIARELDLTPSALGAGLLGVSTGVDPRQLSSGFALALAALLVVTALNPWSWGLPALLLLAGASMTISNTAANTLVQSTAVPHLLGRTVNLYMLAIRGGGALGALLTGAAIGRFGVQHAAARWIGGSGGAGGVNADVVASLGKRGRGIP